MNFKEKFLDYLKQDHRHFVEISEPGLEATIYFTPMTVCEFDKITMLAQGQNSAIHIWTVIEKAEDENGKKIFSVEDRPFLEKMPWSVINTITSAMLNFAPVSEVKKTSETTPSF